MKTKISTFITATAFLLFFASIAVTQNPKAYFKKDGKTVFETEISDIDSIVFKQEIEPACEYCESCDWVEINGVKWATRNVGTSKPEDFGGYYTWEEAQVYHPPTLAQIQSLTNSTYVKYEWTTRNSVWGGKFTDRATGNCIFLPAAGYRFYYDGTLYDVGNIGLYWSSTQYDGSDYFAYYLYFNSGNASWYLLGLDKSNGLTVRPVADF